MDSHFFTQKILNSFQKGVELDPTIVLFNKNAIDVNIIELTGNLSQTSVLVGTRKRTRKPEDYIYYGNGTESLLEKKKKTVSHTKSRKKQRRSVTQTETSSPLNWKQKMKSQMKSQMILDNTPPALSLSDLMPSPESVSSDSSVDYKNPLVNGKLSVKQSIIENRKNQIQQNRLMFIDNLANILCQKKIGYGYGKRAVLESLNNNPDYDIVIIANSEIKKVTTIEDKIRMIYGMLVVQKGECVLFPNAYTVHLICTNQSGMSKYLLGLYLYTIKHHTKIEQYGILELASGYTNIAGYCAYRKFGFEYEESIVNNCFRDPKYQNLPMIVDIHNETKSTILQKVLTKGNTTDPLCKITDAEIQEKIALYQNLDYIFTHTYQKNNMINDYYEEYNIDPYDLEIIFSTVSPDFIKQVFNMKNVRRPNFINDFIDQIEIQVFPKEKILELLFVTIDYYYSIL